MKLTLALAALLIAAPAFAQDYQKVRNAPSLGDYNAKLEEVHVSPINADALHGSPLVAVINKTHSAIREISCDGHLWGTLAIAVPGGRIPSGGIGIVNFDKGNCNKGLHVKTGDGQLHDVPGQDVSALTILTIESEEW
jgi:hypothetical protein